MIAYWRSKWKKYLALFVISAVLSFFMNLRWGITFADAFFIGAMTFFSVGLMQIVANLGSFTGLSFGTKTLLRIIRNRHKASTDIKDEYAEHINSRSKFTDSSVLMLFGLLLFLVSVLLSHVKMFIY